MSADNLFDALNPDGSAWVGANAGAGKTYILVSRLARLMLEGALPERILCLTYTRAAAAEMQDRLFELLGAWALMDDAALREEIITRLGCEVDDEVLLRARILFARALETPGGLRVQTIHGFCESLLKRFPLEAGLSPHFDLLDEQDARSLQAGLIADLLAEKQTLNPDGLAAALARLTRALAEPDMLALGRQIIDRRSYFETHEREQRLADLASAMKLPAPLPQADMLLADFAAAHQAVMKQFVPWLAAGTTTDTQQAEKLQAWLAALDKGAPLVSAWPHIAAVFFKADGAPRAKLVTKGRVSENPSLAAALADLGEAVAGLDRQLKALANYHLTEAVYVFADALLARYQAVKTNRSVLDYEDMIAVTNRLLSGPQAAQWVLYKIDNGLHHILIDEAQDTSPAQWQIISALADAFFDDAGLPAAQETARTIFAVGDEKQSIFSFQGADPKAFDAQRVHFQRAVNAIGGAFAQLPLRLSRRSAPQILKAVDLVFDGRAEGVTADGGPLLHEPHRDDAVGHVEIWPPCESDKTDQATPAWQIPDTPTVSGRQRLAYKIADKIAALLADKDQKITAGDILVLVRSRDVFVSLLTRALKRRRVAIAGSDRMVLLEQIAVADILAAMDFALNPTDDMALAIVLRSPLGGFDEAQLFALAHDRKGDLWSALQAMAAHDDTAKSAQKRLVWLLSKIDYLSPYELLAQFLGAQGGHKLLSARLGPEIDDCLSELLRLALAFEAKQAASMHGFLHWLRQGSQEIKRDMESGGGAVRIMTVHGAKGLEAPIVFLPDTCRSPKKTGGSADRVQFDDAKIPLWRANQALRDPYNAAQAAAAERAAAEEEKRLLYVAMTRARERLYIGGWLGARDKAPPTHSWYAMIDSALEDTVRGELAGGELALPVRPGTEAGAHAPSDAPPPDWVMSRPRTGGRGEPYRGDKIFSPSGLTDRRVEVPTGASSPSAEEALAQAAHRGKVIHKLLELLPDMSPSRRAEAGAGFIDSQSVDWDETTRQAILDEALRVMALPQLSAIFSERALAEVPIVGILSAGNGQKMTLSGQIDRMVETDEAVLLVDFKTGTPPQAELIADEYLTQMAGYRALVRAARDDDKPVQCALIWTQNGAVSFLDAAEMNAALNAVVLENRQA